MSGEDVLILVSRWLHIVAAVIAVGGAIFMRFVLMPSARETLDDEQHAALREKVMGRWKRLVMAVIGVLLITGFVNFFYVGLPKAETANEYHAVFGIKFMLALGVFFLASALTGSSKAMEGIRAKAPFWLAVTVGLGIAVIVLGGVLNRL